MPGASLVLFADLGGMSRPKVKCYDLRSIHALRVEGDARFHAFFQSYTISIHALRVEGDIKQTAMGKPSEISIHALRVEGDGEFVEVDT